MNDIIRMHSFVMHESRILETCFVLCEPLHYPTAATSRARVCRQPRSGVSRTIHNEAACSLPYRVPTQPFHFHVCFIRACNELSCKRCIIIGLPPAHPRSDCRRWSTRLAASRVLRPTNSAFRRLVRQCWSSPDGMRTARHIGRSKQAVSSS